MGSEQESESGSDISLSSTTDNHTTVININEVATGAVLNLVVGSNGTIIHGSPELLQRSQSYSVESLDQSDHDQLNENHDFSWSRFTRSRSDPNVIYKQFQSRFGPDLETDGLSEEEDLLPSGSPDTSSELLSTLGSKYINYDKHNLSNHRRQNKEAYQSDDDSEATYIPMHGSTLPNTNNIPMHDNTLNNNANTEIPENKLCEIKEIPGFRQEVSNTKEVKRMLRQYYKAGKDGYYILWLYENNNHINLILSITYLRRTRHYKVHYDSGRDVWYFYKEGPHSATVKELLITYTTERGLAFRRNSVENMVNNPVLPPKPLGGFLKLFKPVPDILI